MVDPLTTEQLTSIKECARRLSPPGPATTVVLVDELLLLRVENAELRRKLGIANEALRARQVVADGAQGLQHGDH